MGNLNCSLKPKKKLKPLMKSLSEISPPRMHYLGTSYGLTSELFGFWLKNGFKPLYIRQTANELTAEHSVIMTKMLENTNLGENLSISSDWLKIFSNDFERRFVSLLSFEFRHFPLEMCLKILEPRLTTNKQSSFEENALENNKKDEVLKICRKDIEPFITLLDLKRLEAYGNNMIDFHMIRDLIPTLAKLFYMKNLPEDIRLSYSQAKILAGAGLQHKSIDNIILEIDMDASQC